MKDRHLILAAIAVATPAIAADAPNFAGEYADKKFLKGQGVFQLSLDRKEKWCRCSLVRHTMTAAELRRKQMGRETSHQKTQSISNGKTASRNAGTGTITRSGSDVILSIKTTRVTDFALSRVLRAEHAA